MIKEPDGVGANHEYPTPPSHRVRLVSSQRSRPHQRRRSSPRVGSAAGLHPRRPNLHFFTTVGRGERGNVWIADRNTKHKLRNFTLSLLEEDMDIHEPGVLTPVKAAKEAAKEDQILHAARAKVAEFESRAPPVTAPAPGAPASAAANSTPPPAQAIAPQDSSSAPAPGP